ncbi:hypothetical protein [Thalassobellus suaedae]|uniref:Uncharacterized protein n=1 Tax=Thalassobellus suaedae TaxID=3074124 RepID=A0ABY9XW31_9FLAO|nr:hypothetical protein RHP51_05105 [Flavobacteriaceae bacterium HL-DH14]
MALNTVKVIFKNSKYNYTTSVSEQTTEKTAKDYFVNNVFDVGVFPSENMQKCITIDFIKKPN